MDRNPNSHPLRGGFMNIVIAVIGCAMVVYHVVSTQILLVPTMVHLNIHLGFCFTLVFLTWLTVARGSRKAIAGIFLLASLLCVAYVWVLYDDLEIRSLFNTTPDLVVGGALIVLSLMAAWRAFGPPLPIVAILCLLYMGFGGYLPGDMRAPSFPLFRLIPSLSIGFTGGLYGEALSVSANYIFLFMVFGSLLQATGGTRFFFEFSKIFSRRLRSGAALSAIIGSCLMGTITGNAAANVAVIGSFTIPLMKKSGYSPDYAGGIEASASTGGQIMPPVMGAAAFALVAFTGIPYLQIMIFSFVPALLYFFSLALHAQLAAARLNVINVLADAPVDRKQIWLGAPIFVLPLAVLLYILFMSYSPMFAAAWAIMTMLVVSFARKETRPSLPALIRAFTEGARIGAGIGAACAAIGLVVGSLQETGLVNRLPILVEDWSGGNLPLALIITFLISLVLGCGMPTLAVYVTVAMVTAPVLIRMGLPMLQAHLFVLFSAVFSFITPPVAVASLVASRMAGTTYMKTSVAAVRIASVAYLLPFLVALAPGITLQSAGAVEGVLTILAALFALVALGMITENHWLRRLSPPEWFSALTALILLMFFLLVEKYLWWSKIMLVVGVGSVVVLTVIQYSGLRRLKAESLQVHP